MAFKQSPKPNSGILDVSWAVFGVGTCYLTWAIMGWERLYYDEGSVDEGKPAFATLVSLLLFALGVFLRRTAYHGMKKTIISLPSGDGDPGGGGD